LRHSGDGLGIGIATSARSARPRRCSRIAGVDVRIGAEFARQPSQRPPGGNLRRLELEFPTRPLEWGTRAHDTLHAGQCFDWIPIEALRISRNTNDRLTVVTRAISLALASRRITISISHLVLQSVPAAQHPREQQKKTAGIACSPHADPSQRAVSRCATENQRHATTKGDRGRHRTSARRPSRFLVA